MNTDDEPKGFCPFCDVTGWRICDHFTGYVRGDMVTNKSGQSKRGISNLRPKRADDIAVNTEVSVRAYRKWAYRK